MIPLNDLLLFGLACMLLTISPGPSMIYLISKTLVQGKKAGILSVLGVNCGSIFHICLMCLGLSIILSTVPMAFLVIKVLGVGYLLYLAFKAVTSRNKIYDADSNFKLEKPFRLFRMGFFSNALNPKTALFYISFFPQFIKPEYGSIILQSFELGIVQITISFLIYSVVVLSTDKLGSYLNKNTIWLQFQKWFMASVLTGLAIKIAFTKTN